MVMISTDLRCGYMSLYDVNACVLENTLYIQATRGCICVYTTFSYFSFIYIYIYITP